MMSRTQISLDPEIQQRARQRAAELGVSFAEYVRRLVAKDLGEPELSTSPSVVFNLGSSGGSDVAREKDLMVADSIDAERTREGHSE